MGPKVIDVSVTSAFKNMKCQVIKSDQFFKLSSSSLLMPM